MKKSLIILSVTLLVLLFSCSYVIHMNVNNHETYYINNEDQEIMSIIGYEQNQGLRIRFKYLNSGNITICFDTTKNNYDLNFFLYKEINKEFYYLDSKIKEKGYKSKVFINKYRSNTNSFDSSEYIEITIRLPLFNDPYNNDSIILITKDLFKFKGKNILPDSLLFTYQNKVN